MCMFIRCYDPRRVLLIGLHRDPVASTLDQQSMKGLYDTLDSYAQIVSTAAGS
jgi:hypothetical protein